MTEDETMTKRPLPEDLELESEEDSTTSCTAPSKEDVNGNNNFLLLSSPDAIVSPPRPPVPPKPPKRVRNIERECAEIETGNGLLNLDDSGVETFEQSEEEVRVEDQVETDAVRHSGFSEYDITNKTGGENIDACPCDTAKTELADTTVHTSDAELNDKTLEQFEEVAIDQDQNCKFLKEATTNAVNLERSVSDDGITDDFESELNGKVFEQSGEEAVDQDQNQYQLCKEEVTADAVKLERSISDDGITGDCESALNGKIFQQSEEAIDQDQIQYQVLKEEVTTDAVKLERSISDDCITDNFESELNGKTLEQLGEEFIDQDQNQYQVLKEEVTTDVVKLGRSISDDGITDNFESELNGKTLEHSGEEAIDQDQNQDQVLKEDITADADTLERSVSDDSITDDFESELNGKILKQSEEEAIDQDQNQDQVLKEEVTTDAVKLERSVSNDGIGDFESEHISSTSKRAEKSDIANERVDVSAPDLDDNFGSVGKEHEILNANSNQCNNCSEYEQLNLDIDKCDGKEHEILNANNNQFSSCSEDKELNLDVDESSSSNNFVEEDNSLSQVEPVLDAIPPVACEQNLEVEELDTKSGICVELAAAEETQSDTADSTETVANKSFAEKCLSFETAEEASVTTPSLGHKLSLQPNFAIWEDQGNPAFIDSSYLDCAYFSDSEVEMGRRSLSFKRKAPHMVYTEEEFKEHYTTIEKGKSLDSSSKQDVKRGFQRLKAERGGRPLRHTRSLSTPAAESYTAGPSPRSKGRPVSMVEQGTDTSEYFKDHENVEANIRIRGLMSPNETNNNKNVNSKSPAPLKVDVNKEVEVKSHKAQNVNAGQPSTLQTPTSPIDRPPRGPLTVQDLTIISGYSDKKVGVTKPIMGDQNRISLTHNLQSQDNVDGRRLRSDKSPENVNVDVRKTEIAVERQMILKQAIKGRTDDKLSPRATVSITEKQPNGSISPMRDDVSRTVQSIKSRTPPPTSPKPSVQRAGPFTVTTRIVDGEEELTIGNIPEPSRPQSTPVMQMTTGSRPIRHFACIEPVGEPVVGHPPRISHIEPVLVSPMKRPPQQSHLVNSTSVSMGMPEVNGPSGGRSEDVPGSLSAMMSVTVTASTMPELQKPEVTRVDSVDDPVTNEVSKNTPLPAEVTDNVIIPQKELIVETKRELALEPAETKASSQVESVTESKSTSPLSAASSPVPSTTGQSSPGTKSSRNNKSRFPFPSVSKSKSVDVNDEEEDDDEQGIYDASFRNSGWIYIGGNQELQMITGPVQQHQPNEQQQQTGNGKPDSNSIVVKAQVESKPSKKNKYKKEAKEEADDDDVFSRGDPARESVGTTASEEEFKKQYQSVALRRIQRKQSIMDYQRLSLIARERELVIEKENNLFGFRIQYSKPVVVTDVDQGGAAEKAGLKVGDMVLKVNDQDVTQAAHSHVVKLAAAGPDTLVLLVGTNVCNTLNLEAMKPVMSGHLWKLGGTGVFSNWKKRWFVLKQDNVLYYYKTNEDAEPLGAIVLCNYTVVKARDVGKPNAFKLTKHKARTFYMYSSTAEEMNSWAKGITEAARPNSKADIWLDISTHNVSVPALSIKYPDCHGVLTKMGGRRKTWKRRYCVLKDACLYYYKDIDAPQALGVAHFHGYSIQETEIGSKKYAFILKPPEESLRTFYFIADHETDRKRWVAAFAYSIGRWIQTNTGDDSDDEGNEMLI